MNVSILDTGCAYNSGLLIEGFLKLGLDKGSQIAELEVNDTLFQTLRIPERDANAFSFNVRLDV